MAAVNAALAESRGDASGRCGYTAAAERCAGFGMVVEHAFARLGEGRCRVRLSRPAEAAGTLEQARAMFSSMGAAPAIAETEALLDQATAHRLGRRGCRAGAISSRCA